MPSFPTKVMTEVPCEKEPDTEAEAKETHRAIPRNIAARIIRRAILMLNCRPTELFREET